MPLKQGDLLNHERYRIDNILGRGGMGAVYRAWDQNLDIPVAIKENLDATADAHKQFNREATILARLSHPNLPRVTDYFFIPEQGQYLVMDFVEGEDLQSMLDRLDRLPEPQVLNWISQVCDALAYLHSQPSPIIHRDIKPANIRIRQDGRAMLVDFGIAKLYDPHKATTVGAKAVTPGYSPPEQYGGGSTDVRSDIYSLGATLYTLLTGEVPPESVKRMTGREDLSPPHEFNQQISPQIEQAILRSTEISTDKRFQSIQELQKALSTPDQPPTLVITPLVAQTKAIPHTQVATPQTQVAAPSLHPPSSPRAATSLKRKSSNAGKYALAIGSFIVIVAGVIIAAIILFNILPAFKGSFAITRPTEDQAATTSTATKFQTIEPTPMLPPAEVPGVAPAQVTPFEQPPEPPAPMHSVPAETYSTSQFIPVPEKNQQFRSVALRPPILYALTREGVIYLYEIHKLADGRLEVSNKPLNSIKTETTNGIQVFGDFLYSFGYPGLDVFELADPLNPKLINSDHGHVIYNLFLRGDTLVAPGQDGFTVYDVRNLREPKRIRFVETKPGAMHFAAAYVGDRLYLSEFVPDQKYISMIVFAMETAAAPKVIQSIENLAFGYHFFPVENQLISCADSQLEVWSLDDRDNPSLQFSEPAGARVCAFDLGNIITNGKVARLFSGGFKTFQEFDAGSGQGDGFPYGAAIVDGFVFLAQDNQILVLKPEFK